MTRSIWLWPVVITISALAAVLVTFINILSPLRALITFWFLIVCPGMAIVRLLRLKDGMIEWVLAIAVSLALDALVALLMIYSGTWSPEWGLMILIGLSLSGAAFQTAGANRNWSMKLHRLGRTEPSKAEPKTVVTQPGIRQLPKMFAEDLRILSMMSIWIFGFVVLSLLVLIFLETITGGSMLLLALWFLGSVAIGGLALFVMIVQG